MSHQNVNVTTRLGTSSKRTAHQCCKLLVERVNLLERSIAQLEHLFAWNALLKVFDVLESNLLMMIKLVLILPQIVE